MQAVGLFAAYFSGVPVPVLRYSLPSHALRLVIMPVFSRVAHAYGSPLSVLWVQWPLDGWLLNLAAGAVVIAINVGHERAQRRVWAAQQAKKVA